jgi:hypothetical protein
MNTYLVIFFIILTILLAINNSHIERFVDDLFYPNGIVVNHNLNIKSDVDITGNVKTNILCPNHTNNCANSENLNFTKTHMPALKTGEVCIGDACMTMEDLMFLKNYKVNKTNDLRFKVVSSGLVHRVRMGISEFYINGEKIQGLDIGRGFNVLVVSPRGLLKNFGSQPYFKSFDTHKDYDKATEMIDYIKAIPNGWYVLVSVYDEASNFDSPYISVYQHSYSKGWMKKYKLNPDGSPTIAHSTWSGPQHGLTDDLFPNDNISSVFVSRNITGEFFEHDIDQGYVQLVRGKRHVNKVDQNDRISSILFYKTDKNNIVTPYEALKLCGGTGSNIPNYRGSYIFMGRKGLPSGQAVEFKNDASGNSRKDTRIVKEKNFTTPYIFLDVYKR